MGRKQIKVTEESEIIDELVRNGEVTLRNIGVISAKPVFAKRFFNVSKGNIEVRDVVRGTIKLTGAVKKKLYSAYGL